MPLYQFLGIFNQHDRGDEEFLEYNDLIDEPIIPPFQQNMLDSVFRDHNNEQQRELIMNNKYQQHQPPIYKYAVELARMNSFQIPEIGSESTISLETCKRLSNAGFFLVNCSNYQKLVCCCMCFSSFPLYDNEQLTSDPLLFHREKSPNCKFIQNYIEHRSKKIFNHEESMYYERERLDSFIDWPVPWLDPKELAFHGFYYLRKQDHTCCAFCKMTITGWVPELDIKTTHCLINPNCPMLSNNVIFNIPIVASDILKKISPLDENISNSYPIPKLYNNNKRDDHKKKISYDSSILAGVYPTKPLKKYSTFKQRKATFNNENWPLGSVKQTPDELANAGFYYSGIGDIVYCHHCNCGLKNWKIDDDPINEHAKWFPNCSFIKLIEREKSSSPSLNEKTTIKYEREYNISELTDEDFEILITSCLNNSRWLQMYPYYVVKEAIEFKLRITGSPIISTEDLERFIPAAATTVDNDDEGNLIVNKQYQKDSYLNNNDDRSGQDNKVSCSTFLPPQFNHHPNNEYNIDDKNLNEEQMETSSSSSSTTCEIIDSNCEACRQNEIKYKCNICLRRDKNVIFYPCNHVFSCKSCLQTLYQYNQPSFSCPICRRVIEYHAIFNY